MAKIATVTLVKDEDRLIESFVRYNSKFASKMIIIDNGCKDMTVQIINKLTQEGYPIELYSDAAKGYMQAYLENKYIRKAIETSEFDWIIPLDVDEFLDVDIDEFENLDQRHVYYVYWKNYVLTDDSDMNETFVPRRMTHHLVPKKDYYDAVEWITKVILPARLVKDDDLWVTSGHHGVIGIQKNNMVYLENSAIAHFPIISREQLQIKIKGKYISYITNRLRAEDGIHVNRYMIGINNGRIDEDELIKGSYIVKEGHLDYYDLELCPLREELTKDIKMRYTPAYPVDIDEYYLRLAEEFALKSTIASDTHKDSRIKILVYGTGYGAEHMFDRVDNGYQVLAYINSDPLKQYMRFNKKIIVLPDKIKFFDYDYVIISSEKYNKEMYETLLKNHVRMEKIKSYSFLHDSMIMGGLNG